MASFSASAAIAIVGKPIVPTGGLGGNSSARPIDVTNGRTHADAGMGAGTRVKEGIPFFLASL